MDTKNSILRAASRFFSATMLSRIAGMFRDILMAHLFGAGPMIAAFFVSFRLSHFFRRMFGEGPMQSAFIPQYEKIRKESEGKASTFFILVRKRLTLILTLLVLFLIASLYTSFLQVDLPEQWQKIIFYTILLLPSLIPISLYGLESALLQCRGFYFRSGVAPVFFNLVWIASAFASSYFLNELQMFILCLGVVAACFSQWLWAALKNEAFISGEKDPHFTFPMIELSKAVGFGMLGVGATQMNALLDSLFANFADPSGPAYLWYAFRLQHLPLALFGVAISSAILPPLSRAAQDGDSKKWRLFLRVGMTQSFYLLLPMTVILIVFGVGIVQMIYQRGAFTFYDVEQSVTCLWGYAPGLLPTALVLMMSSSLYAKRNYKIPSLLALLSIGSNVVLNSFFIFVLGMGAAAIALATSISSAINALFLFLYLVKKEGLKPKLFHVKPLLQSCGATFLALAALGLFHIATQGLGGKVGIWQGASFLFSCHFFPLVGCLSLYGGIFFLVLILLQIKKLRQLSGG